jgi:hypothetical protein
MDYFVKFDKKGRTRKIHHSDKNLQVKITIFFETTDRITILSPEIIRF